MFHKKQGGPPDRPFLHSDICKIVKADPGVDIPWSEVEGGHWVRTCQCGEEHYRAPAPKHTRLDPLDPKTARHLGECEFKDLSDPAVLKILLRITEKDGYWWTECAGCQSGWQVPHYVAESAG
jgi:hypothetical protein